RREARQRYSAPGIALNDPAAPRGGLVEVALKDGRTVSQHTRFPPGTSGATRLFDQRFGLFSPCATCSAFAIPEGISSVQKPNGKPAFSASSGYFALSAGCARDAVVDCTSRPSWRGKSDI